MVGSRGGPTSLRRRTRPIPSSDLSIGNRSPIMASSPQTTGRMCRVTSPAHRAVRAAAVVWAAAVRVWHSMLFWMRGTRTL